VGGCEWFLEVRTTIKIMHKFLPHTSKTIYVGELKTRKEGALWYIAAYRPILINAVIEKHTVLL
jgi:hypothetical protein